MGAGCGVGGGQALTSLMQEGGHILWVAPSGGR
jgi:hypothetical protein